MTKQAPLIVQLSPQDRELIRELIQSLGGNVPNADRSFAEPDNSRKRLVEGVAPFPYWPHDGIAFRGAWSWDTE